MSMIKTINNSQWLVDFEDVFNPNLDVKEFAIGGKLITYTLSLTQEEFLNFKDDSKWKNVMREKVVYGLVDAIFAKGMVNTTTQLDIVTQTQHIKAYMYLAPNDQVKIIRELKK